MNEKTVDNLIEKFAPKLTPSETQALKDYHRHQRLSRKELDDSVYALTQEWLERLPPKKFDALLEAVLAKRKKFPCSIDPGKEPTVGSL